MTTSIIRKLSNGNVTSDRDKLIVNKYKIGLNLSSKVNDYVKFNSRFIVGDKANGGFASLNAGKEYNGIDQYKVLMDKLM